MKKKMHLTNVISSNPNGTRRKNLKDCFGPFHQSMVKKLTIIAFLVFVIFSNAEAQQRIDYKLREQSAPESVKTKLQDLRHQLELKGLSSRGIGYTTALDQPSKHLKGLIIPPDFLNRAKARNQQPSVQMRMRVLTSTERSLTRSITWDWRTHGAVTPVRPAQQCGDCWAFATTAAFESAYLIANPASTSLDLSEQDVLSCSGDGDCTGGWVAFDYIQDHGRASQQDYAYSGTNSNCVSKFRPFRATNWAYVDEDDEVPSVSRIKDYLVRYGPLWIAMKVPDTFFAWSTDDVYNDCESGDPDHAVIIIGWDDNKGAWLIKNSWGTGWGDPCGYGQENGYAWVKYNCNKIGYAAAWVQAAEESVWKVPPIAMTSLGNSIHIIENQTLWRVNPSTGSYVPKTPASDPAPWKIAPIVMTSLGNYLYVIENQTLWQVNPNTGAYSPKGPLSDPTPWKIAPIAMTSLGNYLYIIENQTLWQVNPNTGAYTPKGPATDPAPWKVAPIAMTSLGNYLYVIENQTLWQVNPNTGTYSPKGPTSDPTPWKIEPIAMTSLGNYLYVIENQRLWRVNPNTGTYVEKSTAGDPAPWKIAPIAMTSFGGYIYVIEGERLWKVNPNTGGYDQVFCYGPR
jgi:C1A family cysteine protease